MRVVRFIFMVLVAAFPLRGMAQWQMPVSEDFDSYGSRTLPPGWSASCNYDIGPLPHLDSTQHHGGTKSLELYSGSLTGSHYSIAIGPEADAALGAGVFVRFHYYAATTAVRLEVGVCDDTGRYTRNFVPLDTVHVQQGQRWQEVVVDLSPYTGTGRRVAFRLQRGLQVESSYCYVDDLRVESCGTTQPQVSHLGAYAMTLDWERYGAGSVTVSYNGQLVEDAVAPLTLTDLQPLTDYALSVGCPGGTQHLLTVSTLAGEGLFPAYRDATERTLLPAEGDSSLLVLPLLQSGVAASELNLSLYLTGDDGTSVVAGVMDYALEPESFVPLDTLWPTDRWERQTVAFGSYGGTGRYLALLARGGGNLRIKELRVARCLIDSVRLYDLSDVAVTVAWDTVAPAAGATVTVEWGPRDFEPGSGTLVTATTNPFVLTGLQPSTEYDLLITPACGDTPTDMERHRLVTFAHEVTAPYCMTFEESGAGMPQGWVCPRGEATLGDNSYEGNHSLHLGAHTVVTLPRVNTDDDTVLLDFYSYGSGTLEVGFMTNPYSTFHPVATVTGGSGWRRQLVPLTLPEGQVVALRSTTPWDLDALAVHLDAVTAVSVSAIGQHSVHVGWLTERGDSVTVEYSAVASATADFADGTGSILRRLDSVTLTGLQPDTYYALHLRPASDGDGCLYQRHVLQTAAGAIALPYCQNYDDVNGLPDGWRRASRYGEEYPVVSRERNHSPDQALLFAATATAPTVALLPDFATSSQHLMLAFWTNVSLRPEGALLLVGRMSDISDLGSFVATDTLRFTASERWEHHEVLLGGDTAHVALMLQGGGSGETRLFVDDLCVEPCAADSIRLTHVDSTEVSLQWRSYGARMDILVEGDGFSVRDTIDTTAVTVHGLTVNSPYTILLRALCDCGGGGATYALGYGSSSTVAQDQRCHFSFNTHASLQPTPYCITFESQSTGSTPGLWHGRGKPFSVSDRNYHEGSHSLIVGDSSYLVLPPMEAVSGLTMSLYAYASSETALTAGAFTVGVTTDPDSAAFFTVTDTLTISRAGEWQRLWSDFASYGGDGHYIVLHTLAEGCTFFLDDLSVSSCGIGAADVDASGEVTWEGLHAPDSVAIEYGLQGFPIGSGQRDTTTASSYTLQHLTAGENYDIYLTPFCGEKANCMATKVTLGTPDSTPYCEQFEMVPPSGMPTGWSIGRTCGATPAMDGSGDHSLWLKGHASGTHRSLAVLPLLVGGDSLQLSLSLRAGGANARLVVGHIGANADPNTFDATDTLDGDGDRWQRVAAVVALPQGRRLALSCLSINLGEASVWVDSLSVTHAVSPLVAASSARTLTLTGVENTFIEYDTAGFPQGAGTLRRLAGGSLEIGGLLPETDYWIYTREDSATLTCMPPAKIRMPAEAALPYCLDDTTIGLLQLPEMSIDSIRRLHLHFTLQGSVEVGVMEHSGEWNRFVALDTLTTSAGTWREVHERLAHYDGDWRFVGLRAIGGDATLGGLTVTDCPWVSAELRDDNSVLFVGNGDVEYGPAGFTPGSGTLVTVSDTLIVSGLEDTTRYDYYPLCGSTTPCYSPRQWRTSMEVPLPYCAAFGDRLPEGWTVTSNAVGHEAVSIHGGELTINVSEGQEVSVKLPLMAASTVVADMELQTRGDGVLFLIDGDTVEGGEQWQPVRIRTALDGRMTFAVRGHGTVKIRQLSVAACALPQEVTIGQPGGGSVVLHWDSTDVDGDFFVEYRLAGSTDGTAVRASRSPLTLPLLPDTSYSILLACDSLGATCREAIAVTTLANPLALPYCTHFDTRDELPEGWYLLQKVETRYLVLPQFDVDHLGALNLLLIFQTDHAGETLTLGTLNDASDPSTFDSLTSFRTESHSAEQFFYTLAHYYGSGRFLALRIDGGGRVKMEHLSVNDCAAYQFSMTEGEAGHALLEWEQQGTPTVRVTYGPIGFGEGEGTVVTTTESPLLLDNLAPLTDYAFYVSSLCDDDCRPLLVDTFMTFTPKGGEGCIDYTDLHADYVVCQYGTFSNPTEFTGVVDKGYRSALSRHTVHFDTTERDARTGGLLRTVPAGEMASIRLGNWTVSGSGTPQAESITYGMTVDTNEFSLLLLRYAAVLQDPEHSAELQPRFRLQILNQNNVLIDSCGMADFIANPSLIGSAEGGWNQAANEVLWKDWTTVGIDLSAYSGQTIFIRLITNDCGEGSHFGYAYFTLACADKRMQTEGCSVVPDNRFTVPSGFRYRWYTNQDSTTLSDSSSIWVPSDNSKIYYCQLSFIDKPSCNFTMSAFAGARYPLALIDTAVAVAHCEFDLTVTDRSTISGDGETPIGTGESCESRLWILPDSTTSTSASLSFHLTDTGSLTLTLIAGIADDQCIDTLRRTIHISRLFPDATLEGRDRRCTNEAPDTLKVRSAPSYSWSSGETGDLVIAPLADTTVVCFTVDTNGCRDTLSHLLRVFPAYHSHRDDSLCNTVADYQWYDTTIVIDQTEGVLQRTRELSTIDLCDSTFTLALTLMPSYYIHHYDTLCHDVTMIFFDTLLTTTGEYLHIDSTAFGCDSMVTMHLEIVPRVFRNDPREVCDSLVWIDGHTYFHDTLDVRDTLLTPRGCDSVVTLMLRVNHSFLAVEQDTFCEGSQYHFRGHTLTEAGFYADTLSTVEGCDSVLAIELERLDLPVISIEGDYDCDSLHHHLTAHSDVPYLLWTSVPYDPMLDRQENDSIIDVNPPEATVYTLYADYDVVPHCPATTTFTVHPAHKPHAELKVIPQTLVLPQTEFEAYDLSGSYPDRAWYINGQLQSETSRHLLGNAPDGCDTVRVTLVVGDGHCEDSAVALIPLLYTAIAAPNAFTPGNDNNNTFSIVGLGILQAEIRIYNRFGGLVFYTEDFEHAWDGRNMSGDPCPSGSYVWHIRYTTTVRPGAYQEATGSVLLIR